MARLRDLAYAIRSKNAGPYVLSIDIIFRDAASYLRCVATKAIRAEVISRLYQIPADRVQVIEYEPALAVKVVMPRAHPSGSFGDSDVLGAQQHVPLLDLEVA